MLAINTQTSIVVFTNVTSLDETGIKGEGWYSDMFTSADHYLVDAPTPAPWVANGYSHIDGQIVLNADGEAFLQAQAVEEEALRQQRVQAEIVTSTQQRLDTFAKTRNYDSVLSLCTYASSPNAKFQAEGQYGVEARDATWSKLLEILAEVEANTRPMPTGYAEIESELPPLVWPN
jgi:hypothetical protein